MTTVATGGVNEELLEYAIEIAAGERANDERAKSWQNAIMRGAELIAQHRCHPISPTILLILSESGDKYVTNGEECRNTRGLCPAYANRRPCKHRAAHRLLLLLKTVEPVANEIGGVSR
jgi:hypothetical protein